MTSKPLVLVSATTETKRGYSRVVINEAYTRSLVSAGLIPLILPPVDPELAAASLIGVAGLVLTGGMEDVDPHLFGEDPHPATGEPHKVRDAYEIALAKTAHEHRIPTFAICRGAQIMNIALGGNLIQDISAEHPRGTARTHAVKIESDSRFASIVGSTEIVVNSTHHQAMNRPGEGLRVVGRSDDGIVEAIESTDPAWWMVGVQWHTEELAETVEDWDRRLFGAFADNCSY